MPTTIHPTALVEPGAQLGEDCDIHAFTIVKRWAILGDRVTVHPFSVVGGDPQDLKFDGRSESWVRIGAGTRIRESVTVNRATHPGGVTAVAGPFPAVTGPIVWNTPLGCAQMLVRALEAKNA